MKVLQFKTQEEYDEWLNNHELFECYDKDGNLLGSILGPDADNLVSFDMAYISVAYGHCDITKELTEKQIEALKRNTLVKVVITDNLFVMSIEQRAIIRRLRKDFEDAKKVGLFVLTNDDKSGLYFLNGNAFDKIMTDDDLSGEWKEIDGKNKLVKLSEEALSNYVKIDADYHCEFIKGDNHIDFINWGCCALPWYGHLKD